jgi:thiamine biosynthesis lipoprotein
VAAPAQQFWVERSDTAMGGHLGIRVVWERELSEAQRAEVAELLNEISARVNAWAAIATRHQPSQLTRLNATRSAKVEIGPTIAALVAWAADAWELTGGLVNITMLNERIAAERGTMPKREIPAERGWSLTLRSWAHRDHEHLLGGVLQRPLGLQIDLDGVGKGWIADRAVALLERSLDAAVDAGRLPAWRSCFVNGDGDLAVRNRGGATTEISVEIPRDQERAIGMLTVSGASCGVATSGTGVHYWGGRHHLIDPRTGDSAQSGIAQATVVASSAREAEAWAKSIVIDGAAAMRRAEAAGVQQIIAIRDDGEVVSAPALPPLRPHSTYAPAPVASSTLGGAQ